VDLVNGSEQVMVFGSGHSFNDGILSEEALVPLDDYGGMVRRELGEAVSNSFSLNSVHRVFPFKSKFGGNDPTSVAKREAQARRTAEIYQRLRDSGQGNVVALGDLNDTPESAALQPLLGGTDLRDVSEHPTLRWESST
jgi:hypothetical protein